MKKLFLIFLCVFSALYAAENIVVQNRILAKINSQPISVVDVAKKMDFIFFREFQAYAHSEEARLEFYQTNWRSFLDDMIDEQLILSNAKDLKVTVSDGEVRQEIEDTLGPNVIDKIDQMALTYPEVFKMVQNDLIVRRMVYSMVQSKATTTVTPARVKEAYEKYAAEHPLEEAWNYRVVTIRSTTELGNVAAVQMLLKNVDSDKQSVVDAVNSFTMPDVKMTVSEELHRTPKTLSESHKAGLAGLSDQQHSSPIAVSKSETETVCRIFFLNEHKMGGKVVFSAIEDNLKSALIQQAVAVESTQWRKKLRDRYGIDEDYLALMVPSNFQPFSMRQ